MDQEHPSIGALFSCSLIFSNMAYLTLGVSFIQMLKAFTPLQSCSSRLHSASSSSPALSP